MTPPSPASTTSVVVVTWNGADILSRCLRSLAAQTGLPGPLEVVVVDNGSTDGTLRMLAELHPDVRVVALETNTGFTGGANAGIAAATGDYVALINNDAEAEPAFLANARGALEADPAAAAVSGLILLDGAWQRAEEGGLVTADGQHWTKAASGTTLVNSTGGEITSSANGRDRDWLQPLDGLERRSGQVSAFSGGAVMLRRAALERVGVFDERLFMYYEDTDLSWRLRRAGWSIRFERTAVVVHQHAASSGTGTEFFLFHNERNRLLFALVHAPVRVVLTAFARTLLGALRGLLRRDGAAARRKLRAVGSAIRLMPGCLTDRRAIDGSATVARSALWKTVPKD